MHNSSSNSVILLFCMISLFSRLGCVTLQNPNIIPFFCFLICLTLIPPYDWWTFNHVYALSNFILKTDCWFVLSVRIRPDVFSQKQKTQYLKQTCDPCFMYLFVAKIGRPMGSIDMKIKFPSVNPG